MPPSCSFEEAAAIPTAGRSAAAGLLERAHVGENDTVLVTAAGSGVGSFGVDSKGAVHVVLKSGDIAVQID